jgi:hypothetical protein
MEEPPQSLHELLNRLCSQMEAVAPLSGLRPCLRADRGAPAVLACVLLSVVLADGGAPADLARVPLSVVLADGGAPAALAVAPLAIMPLDSGAHAVHAPTLSSAMAMQAFLPV